MRATEWHCYMTRSLEKVAPLSSGLRWKKPVKPAHPHSTTPCTIWPRSEAANANLIVDPETFENQLKGLKKRGFHWHLEIYRILVRAEVPKEEICLLTDDSIEDFYTIVYPFLRKYKMTATNNIITDFTQRKKKMSWPLTKSKRWKVLAWPLAIRSIIQT